MALSRALGIRTTRASFLALWAFVAVSCRDAGDPTAPPVEAARAASPGGPTVGSVVPASAERGVTRDITVNGSGFDQGSAVRLERQGVPAQGITTNATTYVSSRKLIANVTIAADAAVGKYDVAVMTLGGRKGVGIELFAVTYKLDELGIIGGTWSRAHAINDRGEVVGESCTADCLATAFYWTDATGLVNLGTLAGYSRSAAYAINERGQVFGEVSCRGTDPGCGGVYVKAPVRWDRVGAGWTITPVQGCSVVNLAGDNSGKFVINNNDQCIGRTPSPGSVPLVQTLSGGAVINTEPLPPVFLTGFSRANAISDTRMIAGGAAAENTLQQPVVWYRLLTGAWVVLRLGIPSPNTWGVANDISEPDVAGRVRVTGYADQGAVGQRVTSAPRAVRWTLQADASGAWQVVSIAVLPSSTTGQYPGAWGVAVNNAGDAVGIADGHIMDGAPTKWAVDGGRETLPGIASGVKGRAVAINSQGWIVGAVWDDTNKCDRAAIWRQRP